MVGVIKSPDSTTFRQPLGTFSDGDGEGCQSFSEAIHFSKGGTTSEDIKCKYYLLRYKHVRGILINISTMFFIECDRTMSYTI